MRGGFVSACTKCALVTELVAAASVCAGELTINHAEVMTLSDTAAVVLWETDALADTVVRYGTSADGLGRVASSQAFTRFHAAELRDLRAGTAYHYVCESTAADRARSETPVQRFTTLAPPPGEELFRFATMTDTHVGETSVAHVAVPGRGVIFEGVRWREPELPYWELALTAAVDEINAHDVAFTIIKGDLTSGGGRAEYASAKRLFDRLKQPYHVVDGNHDVAPLLLRTFGLERTWYSFDHAGVHFVMLDTEPLARVEATPALDAQFAWLADDLWQHRDRWTYVFAHRPITPDLARGTGPIADRLFELQYKAALENLGRRAARLLQMSAGRSRCVHGPHARRLAGLLRDHGRVAGAFAGHLHRNFVGGWAGETGTLPHIETASTKEYPCGYAITRVFTGGYMQSYYSPREARCREWSAMTREAFARIGWGQKAGSPADRNLVVRYRDIDLDGGD